MEELEYVPFVWYYAEDKHWYKEAVKKNSSSDNNIITITPGEEELARLIREKGEACVIAPYLPPKKYESLFKLKNLKNLKGALTSQEYEILQKEAQGDRAKFEQLYSAMIEEKLGLKVFKPKFTLKDMGGMMGLKRYSAYILAVQKKSGLRIKGIFLVGIPGTGKSFSAKCMAGELGRYLIELNLAKIIEHPNPVFALHRVFEYIEELNLPCLLWIDEIEKMFAGGSENEKRVFGQLLTIMNDLNSPTGYKIDGIFWVTANNIMDIMSRNPEFLRKGRFDELFFVDIPLKQDAREIFKIYAKKFGLWLGKENVKDLDRFMGELIDRAIEIYDSFIAMEGAEIGARFVYTPAEIEQITKEVARRERLKKLLLLNYYREGSFGEISEYDIEEEFFERVRKKKEEGKSLLQAFREMKEEGMVSVKDYEVIMRAMDPIAKSMKEPIRAMRQQSKIFRSADDQKVEVTV